MAEVAVIELDISHGKFRRGAVKGLFNSSGSRSVNRLEYSVLAGRLFRLQSMTLGDNMTILLAVVAEVLPR